MSDEYLDQDVDYRKGGTAVRTRRKPLRLKENYEGSPLPEAEADLADRLSALPEADRDRIYQSLLDRATGVRQYVTAKRIGRNFQGYEIWQVTASPPPGMEPLPESTWEGWVYSQPPSDQALQMVLAYASGKPSNREQVAYDPIIEVLHCVPGKRQWKRDGPESLTVKLEEAEYGEYVNRDDSRSDPDDEELIGYGVQGQGDAAEAVDEESEDEDDDGEDLPDGMILGIHDPCRMIERPE
ncbi:MAG: hypothetical protein ACREJW_03015 [Candidatus Methylomirabilales bacterium]